MKSITFESQAGQDIFALTHCKDLKTFLDIGSCYPKITSNTWTLEQEFGWTGIRVDRIAYDGPDRESSFIQVDSRNAKWETILEEHGIFPRVGYLSLDVDEDTLATLFGIPLAKWRFDVATIEHDSYRLGPGPRDEMRAIFLGHGYKLLRQDVKCDGLEFEDWWIDP